MTSQMGQERATSQQGKYPAWLAFATVHLNEDHTCIIGDVFGSVRKGDCEAGPECLLLEMITYTLLPRRRHQARILEYG